MIVYHGATKRRAKERERYAANREKILKQNNEYRRRRRLRILAFLGGECSCPGCLITEPRFLTIDHVNGLPDHHKATRPSGRRISNMQQVLLREMKDDPRRFKGEYRLLCANCHMATRDGESCPHMED